MIILIGEGDGDSVTESKLSSDLSLIYQWKKHIRKDTNVSEGRYGLKREESLFIINKKFERNLENINEKFYKTTEKK